MYYLLYVVGTLCYISVDLCVFLLYCIFFFFKQKTAYEMRISDWSSDVCSSDLAMIEKAVDYAGQREQFGRPIGSFQAVKHMCAEMAARHEPCRALVWYAAHVFDALPEDASLAACHAKSLTGDVHRFVARTATEVHGGMGFTDLLDRKSTRLH